MNYVRKVDPYVPGDQPNFPDMVKLNTNENPYPPAPAVEAALHDFSVDSLRLYPDPVVSKLNTAIADFYGVKPEQVFSGVGSDDVLAMCFLTFFNSKKPIFFHQFKAVIQRLFFIRNLEQFRPYRIESICDIRKENRLFRVEKRQKAHRKHII